MAIQTPPGWGWDQLTHAVQRIGSASPEEYWHSAADRSATPIVRRIGLADLMGALASGLDDFKANRTDVIFLCVIYPIVGLVLGRMASGYGLLPLLFPLASGFALVGPLAAVGLNEMSRRREQGEAVRWVDAFGVLRAPSIGSIALLGALLVGIFLLWLVAAQVIYVVTLGPEAPVSVAAFAGQVLGTPAGWALVGIGVGAGFLFAVLVLAISVVSFPLLLDRNAGASGGDEPWRDGRVGSDRRGVAGARVAAGTDWACGGHAGAGARDVASVPARRRLVRRRTAAAPVMPAPSSCRPPRHAPHPVMPAKAGIHDFRCSNKDKS
jgi:uncharacterized membrane protein